MTGSEHNKTSRKSGKVGIRQLSEYLGLSACTISKILSGRVGNAKYREETVKRVKDAAKKLGYKPNNIAKALVEGRSWMIGLCLADIANSIFGGFASCFERNVSSQGYGTFVCNSQEDADHELKYVEMLLSRNVEALVISPVSEKVCPLLEDAAQSGCKIVIIDRDITGDMFYRVAINNFEAMKELANRVISCGHKKIAVINGNHADSSLALRIEGIKQAFKDNNLDPERDVYIENGLGTTTIESGATAFSNIMGRQDFKPTAIITLANPLCVGVLLESKDKGIKIGTDISLASFDDSREEQLFTPSISVVSQPVDEMALACASIAVGNVAERFLNFNAEIIWRDSVATV